MNNSSKLCQIANAAFLKYFSKKFRIKIWIIRFGFVNDAIDYSQLLCSIRITFLSLVVSTIFRIKRASNAGS